MTTVAHCLAVCQPHRAPVWVHVCVHDLQPSAVNHAHAVACTASTSRGMHEGQDWTLSDHSIVVSGIHMSTTLLTSFFTTVWVTRMNKHRWLHVIDSHQRCCSEDRKLAEVLKTSLFPLSVAVAQTCGTPVDCALPSDPAFPTPDLQPSASHPMREPSIL